MRVSEVNVCQPHGIETSHRRTKSSEGTSSQSECDVRLGQKQTSRHLQADINRVHRAFRCVPIDIPVLCEWKSPERETDNPYYPSRSSGLVHNTDPLKPARMAWVSGARK